jgi:transposase InsO family protein
VDSFSKWPECFPLKTQEASEVADVLFREIFSRYGAPKTLISDRGRNFMSKLVNALCEIFQVKQHYTSAYHPQTNAACERTNSTIEQAIRAYVDDEQNTWPSLLPGIMMAFRMSPSTQSSQLSPFFMVFGREMALPFDATMIPQDNLQPKVRLHMEEVLKNLSQEIASENIKQAPDTKQNET